MHPGQTRKFGRADLNVTAFGFGTAPVGNIFKEIDEETSDGMFQAAWDAGVRYYDTAPMYGHGLSELRTGQSLRWKSRDDYVLSSKVGRLLKPARRDSINFAPWVNAAPFAMQFDYSYDGTMRSIEDSLQRMALERLDICFIHDIDVFTRGKDQPEVFKSAMDGSYKALDQLRSEGVIKAIGVGVNEWEVCHEALKQRDFDCFLLAGRYTLLEQDALNDFLPLCEKRGAAVVVGGGFNSESSPRGRGPVRSITTPQRRMRSCKKWPRSRRSARPTPCRCPPPRCNSWWRIRPFRLSSPERARWINSARTSPGSVMKFRPHSGPI